MTEPITPVPSPPSQPSPYSRTESTSGSLIKIGWGSRCLRINGVAGGLILIALIAVVSNVVMIWKGMPTRAEASVTMPPELTQDIKELKDAFVQSQKDQSAGMEKILKTVTEAAEKQTFLVAIGPEDARHYARRMGVPESLQKYGPPPDRRRTVGREYRTDQP